MERKNTPASITANIHGLEELHRWMAKNRPSTAKTFEYYAQQGAKLPPLKPLFGDFVPEGALVHFPSRRGCGKSLFCLQLCLAVTHRHESFLGEPVKKHGSSLYLDFEMGEHITQRRAFILKKYAPLYRDKYADDLVIYNTRKSFTDDFSTINDAIQQTRPVLLVIDNLRNALHSANINNGADMASFFSVLNALKEIHGFAIIIVDHFKKHTSNLRTDSDLQSGSGVKTDLSDADFVLRQSSQDKQWRLLRRVKSRLAEESDQAKLVRLNPETLWFELVEEAVNEAEHIGLPDIQDKEELKDLAQALRAQGKSYQEIAQALSKPKTTIYRWLGKEETPA